jgi:hypothetical protein
MKIHRDIIQGSPEWEQIKLGKLSASHFKDILCKGAGRKLYMRRLAGEVLSGIKYESYSNKNMENGIETEDAARRYYEQSRGVTVEQVGFVEKSKWLGCSPDGLVGTDGGIEIKCVIPSTHINTIIRDCMPTEHIPQVQGCMYVTGHKWWDFISYCAEIHQRPFYCTRIYRDEDYIKELKAAVNKFVAELKAMIDVVTLTNF